MAALSGQGRCGSRGGGRGGGNHCPGYNALKDVQHAGYRLIVSTNELWIKIVIFAAYSNEIARDLTCKKRRVRNHTRKGLQYAAGLDLKSAQSITVRAHDRCLILSGLKIQLPKGTFGRISPRSGLAAKSKSDIGAALRLR
ncbi:unnamed protein product [Allacma fusca]|uniref:dUTP diphosphatase n=1 Tax=Allacma fusca TaxID=39272 RepID=A0A8J2J752_9HEXA|nr:unnamed protein product [Allacma fusca]